MTTLLRRMTATFSNSSTGSGIILFDSSQMPIGNTIGKDTRPDAPHQIPSIISCGITFSKSHDLTCSQGSCSMSYFLRCATASKQILSQQGKPHDANCHQKNMRANKACIKHHETHPSDRQPTGLRSWPIITAWGLEFIHLVDAKVNVRIALFCHWYQWREFSICTIWKLPEIAWIPALKFKSYWGDVTVLNPDWWKASKAIHSTLCSDMLGRGGHLHAIFNFSMLSGGPAKHR